MLYFLHKITQNNNFSNKKYFILFITLHTIAFDSEMRYKDNYKACQVKISYWSLNRNGHENVSLEAIVYLSNIFCSSWEIKGEFNLLKPQTNIIIESTSFSSTFIVCFQFPPRLRNINCCNFCWNIMLRFYTILYYSNNKLCWLLSKNW